MHILSGDRSLGQQFTEVVRTWREDSDTGDEERMPHPVPVALPSDSYTRPVLPAPTFIDSTGAAISYGNRWPDGPPDDAYGVESNLERFAPLHSVADALIAYLRREYRVTISEDAAHADDLLNPRSDVARAVRVTPASTDAAPLTFVFTRHPGVMIHAGALHDFPFPACGCDACDETAESGADQMERLVMAVVAGGYGERYPAGRRRWNSYALTRRTDPATKAVKARHRHPREPGCGTGRSDSVHCPTVATLAGNLDRPVTIQFRHGPKAARPAQ